MTQDFQRHRTLNTCLREYKLLSFKCLLNYISSWFLSRFLSSRADWFAVCCFQSYMNIAWRGTQNAAGVSNFYGVLGVKCKRKWFWDKIWQLALQVWRLAKFRGGWAGDFGNWIKIWFFESFDFAQSPLLPCKPHNSRMNWLNIPV